MDEMNLAVVLPRIGIELCKMDEMNLAVVLPRI